MLEFRHPTWEDPEVHEILAGASAALCHADSLPREGEADPQDAVEPSRALVPTARFGYLRLRRPSYTEDELDAWEAALRAQDWDEVYVFFKHEEAGAAPRMARAFGERFAS